MIRSVLCLTLVMCTAAAGAAEIGKGAAATLKDASGKSVGTATFREKKGKVQIRVKVSGLPAGKHGIHVHENGVCEPPGFSTAGAHYNPLGKRHGAMNPEGKHVGDLPNLVVKPDGTGELTAMLEGATLSKGAASLLKKGGTALVIHAGPDDEKSDPAGQSGDRIVCGVIVAK